MARILFDKLVCVLEPAIDRLIVRNNVQPPWPQDLAIIKNSAKDVMSITFKCLAMKSDAEHLRA